jgi:hypothetical protein
MERERFKERAALALVTKGLARIGSRWLKRDCPSIVKVRPW